MEHTYNVNPTALSLLGFLHKEPMSGLDIIAVATQTIGPFWSLTTSQIYSEIKRLLNAGYIEQAATRAHSTRVYAVTKKGRQIFEKHINVVPGDETIRYPLLLFLQFGEYIQPAIRREILETHRQKHQEQLQHYESMSEDSTLGAYDQATLLFGKRYEQMVLQWLTDINDILPNGKAEDKLGND